MKTFLAFATIVAFTAFATSPTPSEECPGNARTQKVSGFDIYLYSEPVKEYEVTTDLTSTIGLLAAFGDSNLDLKTIVDGFVSKAKRKVRKKGAEIDAIIIESAEKASGIKYID